MLMKAKLQIAFSYREFWDAKLTKKRRGFQDFFIKPLLRITGCILEGCKVNCKQYSILTG